MQRKILIIEDDKALMAVLVKKLEQAGYNVIGVQDGEEGLKLLRKQRENIDIVLLDMILPKVDGFAVLETLQSDTRYHPIPPIIIISNSGQPVEIERAKGMGVHDYLIKTSFDPEEVLEKVKMALKKTVKQKILIIEDEIVLSDIIKRKFEIKGFTVTIASDGEQGIEKLRREKHDLVLLDLVLPGVDGFSILKSIKEDSKLKKIPVIILSNLGQKDEIQRGLKLGAVEFLVKAHLDPNDIVEKVEKILQQKQ